MRLGIRYKVLLYFFIPVLVISSVIEWVNYQQMMDLLKERQVFDFAVKSNQLNTLFSKVADDTEKSATYFRRDYLPMKDRNPEHLFALLEKYLANFPEFSGMSLSYINEDQKPDSILTQYFVGRKGNTFERRVSTINQLNFLNDPYITKVSMQTITNWSATYKDSSRSESFITSCSFPLVRDNQIEAIVTLDLPSEEISEILNAVYNDVFHYTLVTGERFALIYSTEDSLILRKDHGVIKLQKSILDATSTQIVEKLMREEDSTRNFRLNALNLRLNNGTELLLVTNKVRGMQWRLFIGIPMSQLKSKAFYDNLPRFMLFIVLLLLLFVVLSIVSRRVAYPVIQMQQAMQHFSVTGKTLVIDTKRNDEIGDLANAFTDMQNRLIQREKDMQKLEIAKSNFLHLISHEIRTPLNGILGSAFFLREQYGSGEMTEFIDMLSESADRLESLSAKALMITELNTWAKDMTKEQKVIKTLVEEVNSQNPTLLKEHNISINYEITDQRSCLLIADIFKMALKEIFLNTSRNAFPDSTLTVSSKNNDTSFTLSFTNQGPVIEADRLEGLGKPFELGEEHHDKHTGLGLAVVNTIMEMHNGSMQIENDGDRGVITRLIFPTA